MLFKKIILVFLFGLGILYIQAQIIYSNTNELLKVPGNIPVLEDTEHRYNLEQVLEMDIPYYPIDKEDVINFKHTESKFWLRFDLQNRTGENLYLIAGNPMIHYLNVYVQDTTGAIHTIKSGTMTPHHTRSLESSDFSFNIGNHTSSTIIIETYTPTDFIFELFIGGNKAVIEDLHHTDILNGIWLGIMLAMILYNLFILFNIRDKIYLYYILHISVAVIMMLRFKGIGFDLIWPQTPWLNQGTSIFTCFIVITSILFSTNFLDMEKYAPKANRFFQLLAALAVLNIIPIQLDIRPFANIAIQSNAAILSISLFFVSIYIYFTGNMIAKYYILAWTTLLASNIILILTLNGVLPINTYTLSSFQFGSAIEAILLSNALADKINRYKSEKHSAQQLVFEQAKENERLVREQNIILEKRVNLRTEELKQEKERYEELNMIKDRIFAILGHDLRKPALSFRGIAQKVNYLLKKKDYERINLIGQAMEQDAYNLNQLINNLLNWALTQKNAVPHNPNDVELEEVMAEILTFFKRIASEKKIQLKSDIPDGLTLWVDRNVLLTILRNLLDNALKYTHENGEIIIKALQINNKIEISIKDDGVGMPPEKLVGLFELNKGKSEEGTASEKGTGLGLHLVQELSKINRGEIEVRSELGIGTEFIIQFPKKEN